MVIRLGSLRRRLVLTCYNGNKDGKHLGPFQCHCEVSLSFPVVYCVSVILSAMYRLAGSSTPRAGKAAARLLYLRKFRAHGQVGRAVATTTTITMIAA